MRNTLFSTILALFACVVVTANAAFPTNTYTKTLDLDKLKDDWTDIRPKMTGYEDLQVNLTYSASLAGYTAMVKVKSQASGGTENVYLVVPTGDVTIATSNVSFFVSHTNAIPNGTHRMEILLLDTPTTNVVRRIAKGTLSVTDSIWDDSDETWSAASMDAVLPDYLTKVLAATTYYAVAGDTLEGIMNAGGYQITNAIFAGDGAGLTNLPGALPTITANIDMNGYIVTNGVASNMTYYGDAAGLTNLNASNLASGTVPNARLDAEIQEWAEVSTSAYYNVTASDSAYLNATGDTVTVGNLIMGPKAGGSSVSTVYSTTNKTASIFLQDGGALVASSVQGLWLKAFGSNVWVTGGMNVGGTNAVADGELQVEGAGSFGGNLNMQTNAITNALYISSSGSSAGSVDLSKGYLEGPLTASVKWWTRVLAGAWSVENPATNSVSFSVVAPTNTGDAVTAFEVKKGATSLLNTLGSGKVGIGTTAEGDAKLSVQIGAQPYADLAGDWNIGIGVAVDTTSISGMDFKNFNAGGQVRLMARNDQNDYLFLNSYGSTVSGSMDGIAYADSAAIKLVASTDTDKKLIIATSSAGDIVLATSNTVRMVVSGTTGNVGIGTNAPAAKLHVVGAIASGYTASFTTAGPTDNLDVSLKNTIFVDASGGTVTIGGFAGGVAGQVLRIVRIESANDVILENAEAGGSQDIYLSAEGDETLSTIGGWTLMCNGTSWFEVSN